MKFYIKYCNFAISGRVPYACASGSGYALTETWRATPVLHSLRSLRAFRCYPSRGYARVHIRCAYALGMRRACVQARMVRTAPKRSVARSTPTAPQSKQERPNKTFINNVLMHHPKSRIERKK